jgi:hypothetical protein
MTNAAAAEAEIRNLVGERVSTLNSLASMP